MTDYDDAVPEEQSFCFDQYIQIPKHRVWWTEHSCHEWFYRCHSIWFHTPQQCLYSQSLSTDSCRQSNIWTQIFLKSYSKYFSTSRQRCCWCLWCPGRDGWGRHRQQSCTSWGCSGYPPHPDWSSVWSLHVFKTNLKSDLDL